MATPHSKILANWTAIRSLAPDRFDAYVQAGDADELDAVARYVWNLTVAGRFYSIFNTVEVSFRNQLHNALSASHGPYWYDTAGILTFDEQRKVTAAKQTLTAKNKPIIPGRVVAELTFGFWTQLYGKQHEHDIIRPTIHQVFPHYNGSAPLRRSVVAPLLREIRFLRNRIAHHEHIIFDPNIARIHDEAFTLAQWMSSQLAEVAAIDDDVLAVYGRTWRAYRPIVEQLFK